MPTCHCIVKGRVQGVGFRYFTFTTARKLGIKGWVKNLDNGDVEIHAEGDEAIMKEFLAQVYSGPSFASVVDVEVREIGSEPYREFTVKR